MCYTSVNAHKHNQSSWRCLFLMRRTHSLIWRAFIEREKKKKKKKAALLGTSLHDTTPASNYVKYSLVGLSAVVAAYFCK